MKIDGKKKNSYSYKNRKTTDFFTYSTTGNPQKRSEPVVRTERVAITKIFALVYDPHYRHDMVINSQWRARWKGLNG